MALMAVGHERYPEISTLSGNVLSKRSGSDGKEYRKNQNGKLGLFHGDNF
jgi:hypothetical protein